MNLIFPASVIQVLNTIINFDLHCFAQRHCRLFVCICIHPPPTHTQTHTHTHIYVYYTHTHAYTLIMNMYYRISNKGIVNQSVDLFQASTSRGLSWIITGLGLEEEKKKEDKK